MVEIDDLLRDLLSRYLRPPVPSDEQLNVTMGQRECLYAISQLQEPTMSEVAKALRLHPSTVTVLVDGLVAHGLVERRADPTDRRVVRVAETTQGQTDRKRHRAYMRTRVEKLLSELSDEEIEQVHESLRVLVHAAQHRLEVEESA